MRGTPADFTIPKAMGLRFSELKTTPVGYDHNYVINRAGKGLALAARVFEPKTGRIMEVHTTQPGVQLYTGNFLDGSLAGKQGGVYHQHAGFCLETQHYPDSINHPGFPSIILRPGQYLPPYNGSPILDPIRASLIPPSSMTLNEIASYTADQFEKAYGQPARWMAAAPRARECHRGTYRLQRRLRVADGHRAATRWLRRLRLKMGLGAFELRSTAQEGVATIDLAQSLKPAAKGLGGITRWE